MQQTINELKFVVKDAPLTFDAIPPRTARLMCAVAIARVLGEPVASVAVLATCGRVAVCAVEPVRGRDPIMPVILANVKGDWYGHLNNWWFHQAQWEQVSGRRRDYRLNWYDEGKAILARLLDHIRPYLSPDEYRVLHLELSAALAVPGGAP